MSFHNVTFPDAISYSSEFGPSFKTLISETVSGREERIPLLEAARHRIDVNLNAVDVSRVSEVKRFAMMRQGSAFGFRVRDRSDYNSTPEGRDATDMGGTDISRDDQVIGTGDGTTTEFQLTKRYTDGVSPNVVRTITHPRASSVLIEVDGSLVTPSGNWSVSDTTGIVTFTTAPATGEVIKAGFEFDVPVRFDQSVEDFLAINISDYDSADLPTLSMIEIIGETPGISDFYPGGANEFSFDSNTAISLAGGRVKTLTATATGLEIGLPAKGDLPMGADYFVINVPAASSDFDLTDTDTDTKIATLTADAVYIVSLGFDGSGNAAWIVN